MLLVTLVVLAASNFLIGRKQEETEKALAAQTRARHELESALEREQQSLYFQRIARADLEWWNNNVDRADQILDGCADQHRRWEWRFLKRLCNAELTAFHGHTREVRCVAFSPDGQRLAPANKANTV